MPPAHLPATQLMPMEALSLYRGGTLHHFDLAYETWGVLNPAGNNAILLFTGLSPSAHAASSTNDPQAGWWEFMIGPGKPIDTDNYFVVCVNALGGCFGSTGPASINPSTGKPYAMDFPLLSVEDIACSAQLLMAELQISEYTVVGASLGGMVALVFAVMFPNHARDMISISATTQADPNAIAVRSLQREIIMRDSHWCKGDYAGGRAPVDGMRLARQLGIISYRSAREWQLRFGRAPAGLVNPNSFTGQFAVESYLQYNANKFAEQFDANSYLYLSRAMDRFDLAEHGQSLDDAWLKINTRRNLIIGVETDQLFPLQQQQAIADGLKRQQKTCEMVVLPSLQGHDAFLVDEVNFAPVIRQFFS